MALWQCSFQRCDRPAVRRSGDCILCDRHLCRLHLQDPWHQCPKPDQDWPSYSAKYAATETRQMKELSSQLNGSALCKRASLLRSGIHCTVDLSPRALSKMMGGQNCHAEICFDDNVRWIARFRLSKTSSPPAEIQDYVLKSEAATMEYLQRFTRIPCPKIYDWCCEDSKDNEVGVGYILMEKVHGKPLNWQAANVDQKEKVMQQLADIYLEIEQHPFAMIGSILQQQQQQQQQSTNLNGFNVGGIAQPATFRLDDDDDGGPLGPFNSSLDGSKGLVERFLRLIASGEIGGICPVDVYLAHRFCLDVLQLIWQESPNDEQEQFFLVHPDDKGDHILVNEAFDITAVVDWEWTQTVPKQLAFSSPCMMWPVDRFYEGSNVLSDDELRFAAIFEERGRDDLAAYVQTGRKVQRLFFFLGSDPYYTDWKTFLDLFAGLQRAFDATEKGWDQWKTEALEKYHGEKLLRLLLEATVEETDEPPRML